MKEQVKTRKSWRDVTINEYFDLLEAMKDGLEDYEKEVKMISFANCMDESEVWNLDIETFKRLSRESRWMSEFEIRPDVKFRTIKIGETKCDVKVNMQEFTVAQYIDFQTFWPRRKEMDKYMGNILACFIVPHGMKYADGYDIQNLAESIRDSVDIMTANEIILFFLRSSLDSTKAMLTYLRLMTERCSRKTKDPEKKEKLEKAAEEIRALQKSILDGFRSLTG